MKKIILLIMLAFIVSAANAQVKQTITTENKHPMLKPGFLSDTLSTISISGNYRFFELPQYDTTEVYFMKVSEKPAEFPLQPYPMQWFIGYVVYNRLSFDKGFYLYIDKSKVKEQVIFSVPVDK